MKRSIFFNTSVLCMLLLMSACRFMPQSMSKSANSVANTSNTGVVDSKTARANDNENLRIEKIPFRIGVSSITVERLAQQHQCETKEGAGLLTPKGPVEIYRLACTNGQIFMARCELRQCQPMNTPSTQQ